MNKEQLNIEQGTGILNKELVTRNKKSCSFFIQYSLFIIHKVTCENVLYKYEALS